MTGTKAFTAPRIFDGENWHENASLVVEDGLVCGIVARSSVAVGTDISDFPEGMIVPGFVDLQVNGGGGVLFNNDPTVDGIRRICAAHIRFGTTAVFPTLITDTPQIVAKALVAGAAAMQQNVPGFVGLHLEGPHLSQTRKGAHDPGLIRPMTNKDVTELVAARANLPALIVTVAPESATPAQVRALCAAGISVSIGHSDASAMQVQGLIDAGASMITHLFNAMSQITGRDPGMVGTALNCAALHIGVIADGHHVSPDCIALALRAKQGPGRIFLISDAMSTVGTDITELVLNGRRISRAGGKLTLEDGTLAGADLEMATAVRVTHNQVGIDLGEALRMATVYPALAAGLKMPGRLTAGAPARFVWLDGSLRPKQTWMDAAPVI